MLVICRKAAIDIDPDEQSADREDCCELLCSEACRLPNSFSDDTAVDDSETDDCCPLSHDALFTVDDALIWLCDTELPLLMVWHMDESFER